MDKNEIWRPVVGYEDRYLVSNIGRVKSLWRKHGGRNGVSISRTEHIMRPFDNGKGYKVVPLGDKAQRKNHYVHRLVAIAFCENPNGYEVVNHIDGNRSNNQHDNLEWCTTAYNIKCAAPQMRKPKGKVKSNTGEKYIRLRATKTGRVRYCLYIRNLKVCRNFDTLSDAVRYRDEVMTK